MTLRSISNSHLAGAAVTLALLAGATGFGLAQLGRPSGSAPASPAKPERKVLYWYDAMAPGQHFDKPGKSPFMDMPLTPKYADDGAESGGDAASGVKIDAGAIQSLGVRLATVESGDFSPSIDAAGAIDFNQRNQTVVQARAAGFVQRVYGRAPGDVIPAGAPIADILSPAWAGAQAEYLAVRKTGDAELAAASRQRLVLLGMPTEVISAVEHDGRPRNTTTITSPIGGAIQTLDVRQGMTVAMGQTLAQVSGLSSVWLNAAVPEALAGQVKLGDRATALLAAFPGEAFAGRVAAILPSAQVDSHTLTVRIELANPKLRLKPGMYAQVRLSGATHPALFVPSEAVIRTGKRTIVMAAGDNGRFTPVEVQLGREEGHRTEVLNGLDDGQKIVASGQFLIDSEASLAGVKAKPLEPPAQAQSPGPGSVK